MFFILLIVIVLEAGEGGQRMAEYGKADSVNQRTAGVALNKRFVAEQATPSESVFPKHCAEKALTVDSETTQPEGCFLIKTMRKAEPEPDQFV